MPTRTLAWLTLFVLLIALALRVKPSTVDENNSLPREQAAYQFVKEKIKDRYVREVKDTELFYGAMDGMANSLDPFSRFLEPRQYEELSSAISGILEDVGIDWDTSAQGIVVLTPLQDSPAYFGGVQPGDRILKINGVPVEGSNLDDASSRVRAGAKVRLTLLHENAKEPVEIELTRAIFEVPSITIAEFVPSELLNGKALKIGYVLLSQFQDRTAADLDEALNQLEKEGMQALVLDLRQNPGGSLESGGDVADLFLKDGEIVTVTTREARKNGSPGSVTYAKEEGTHPDYPIAVLVDGQTASAAEIVSGALKDRGRAVLVGTRTYGKFSVQDIIPVPLDNWGQSALKLTIARYKTAKSACIDGQGLEPDIPAPLNTEQHRALQASRRARFVLDNDPRNPESRLRTRGGGKGPAPSRHEGPALPSTLVDVQLKKAVTWLAERFNGAK